MTGTKKKCANFGGNWNIPPMEAHPNRVLNPLTVTGALKRPGMDLC